MYKNNEKEAKMEEGIIPSHHTIIMVNWHLFIVMLMKLPSKVLTFSTGWLTWNSLIYQPQMLENRQEA